MDQRLGGEAEQTEALPLSQILFRIAEDETRARVSIGDIFEALGDRAFGALILIFALPNIVPTPPGTSAITGAPLVFLAAQLMLGWQPWLPGWITKRSLARADFSAIVARIVPWLARGERLLKPRFGLLVKGPAENLLGIMAFILAIILALPIPLGNILPAIALSLFAFALLEKDGLYAVVGSVVFLLSIVVVAGVIVALGKAALLLFSISFG
ncbi:exopolysaccharide biosynthesis protein [Agrobacterium vitis]|uniref:Exopolysaccharide biosynthesis protein n=1 Tax=Agrobacterium vitis TaxID=373 RepID=A0A7K1RLQ3_AGRVI|nr:exopolysaccharide biosynthesis protein [Agrobacterium vitis]MVA58799.1 exopolysaccharide biosynthesis protein [Agrobacterium vitis]